MKTIISFIVVLLAAVLMAQSVVCDENQELDNLDIQYPALFSEVVPDSEAPLAFAAPRRCNNNTCQRLCLALYYRYGRCISSTVCRCSN